MASKEELLAKLAELPTYEPAYEEGVESDCPCCCQPGRAYMERYYSGTGDWLDINDVRALLNDL